MFSRTKNLRLSVIKQIEQQASAHPDVISLAQGIPSFDTPDCIKRRAEIALKRGAVAKYSLSPGLPELRELIEYNLALENMYYDWQNEIIVTAGSIEALTATLLTIAEEGDEIIIPEPTYTTYREVIMLAGCKPVFVPLNEEKGWSFELEKYRSAITPKTRAILYCNPNNPTGTIYTRKQLLGLADLAEKHNLYLVSDEVYKDFVYDENYKCELNHETGKSHIFSLAEIPELRKRLIRIFSFSKTYAMTGWRVGYLHTDISIAQEILKVHDTLVTCAPVISQYAAMGALEMGEKDVQKFNEQFKKRRDIVCQKIGEMPQYLSFAQPHGAYYVFPKILKGEQDSMKFALDLLEKAQVAVVPGFAFGPNGEGHFRINFGRSEEDLNKALDRIGEYFNNK
jgi:aminotransferase